MFTGAKRLNVATKTRCHLKQPRCAAPVVGELVNEETAIETMRPESVLLSTL